MCPLDEDATIQKFLRLPSDSSKGLPASRERWRRLAQEVAAKARTWMEASLDLPRQGSTEDQVGAQLLRHLPKEDSDFLLQYIARRLDEIGAGDLFRVERALSKEQWARVCAWSFADGFEHVGPYVRARLAGGHGETALACLNGCGQPDCSGFDTVKSDRTTAAARTERERLDNVVFQRLLDHPTPPTDNKGSPTYIYSGECQDFLSRTLLSDMPRPSTDKRWLAWFHGWVRGFPIKYPAYQSRPLNVLARVLNKRLGADGLNGWDVSALVNIKDADQRGLMRSVETLAPTHLARIIRTHIEEHWTSAWVPGRSMLSKYTDKETNGVVWALSLAEADFLDPFACALGYKAGLDAFTIERDPTDSGLLGRFLGAHGSPTHSAHLERVRLQAKLWTILRYISATAGPSRDVSVEAIGYRELLAEFVSEYPTECARALPLILAHMESLPRVAEAIVLGLPNESGEIPAALEECCREPDDAGVRDRARGLRALLQRMNARQRTPGTPGTGQPRGLRDIWRDARDKTMKAVPLLPITLLGAACGAVGIIVCTVGIALLMPVIEPRAATEKTYVEAVLNWWWWTWTTLTTVGYGDIYPTTVGGRVIAVVLVAVGDAFPTLFGASAVIEVGYRGYIAVNVRLDRVEVSLGTLPPDPDAGDEPPEADGGPD
jgi:hypothetical protein